MRQQPLKNMDRGYKYDYRPTCASTSRFLREADNHKITELPLKSTQEKRSGLLEGVCIGLVIIVFLCVFCGLIGWVDLIWPD